MKLKPIACEYEILIERQYIKCKVIRGSKESRIIGSNSNLNQNLFVNVIFKMTFKLPTLSKSLETKQHQYKQLLKYNIIA